MLVLRVHLMTIDIADSVDQSIYLREEILVNQDITFSVYIMLVSSRLLDV